MTAKCTAQLPGRSSSPVGVSASKRRSTPAHGTSAERRRMMPRTQLTERVPRTRTLHHLMPPVSRRPPEPSRRARACSPATATICRPFRWRGRTAAPPLFRHLRPARHHGVSTPRSPSAGNRHGALLNEDRASRPDRHHSVPGTIPRSPSHQSCARSLNPPHSPRLIES